MPRVTIGEGRIQVRWLFKIIIIQFLHLLIRRKKKKENKRNK